MSYGQDAFYTRWSWKSLPRWIELSRGNPEPLFHPLGVLFTALPSRAHFQQSLETLTQESIPFQYLDNSALREHYPQINFPEGSVGLFEPESGALMARRGVRAVVEAARQAGAEYRLDEILAPESGVSLRSLKTRSGIQIEAGQYVFACGAWLPRLFPRLLQSMIHPTRQEVFYFGIPTASSAFRPTGMPIWIDFGLEAYSFPDLEARGFKFAMDRHGPAFDPELGSRRIGANSVEEIRKTVGQLFPAVADAPLLETRVCQYENSNNGDLIIDRHPDLSNTWIVGGGSGHGFKHGPAVGEFASALVQGSASPEPRFLLKSQPAAWRRSIQ